MELHLPWRRRANGPANAEPVAPAVPRPLRDWASVAPLRPTVRARPPALLDPERFRGDLASTWSTPPALERLGHLVTPDAPAGLLPGLAVPVQSYDVPALRFAPAREEVPAPAASRSWWPAALSRRAQPDLVPDSSAGRHQDRTHRPDPSRPPATGPAAVADPPAGQSADRSAAHAGPPIEATGDGPVHLRPTLGGPADSRGVPAPLVSPAPLPGPATFVRDSPGEARPKDARRAAAEALPRLDSGGRPARLATAVRAAPGASQPNVAARSEPDSSRTEGGPDTAARVGADQPPLQATFVHGPPGPSQPTFTRQLGNGMDAGRPATRSATAPGLLLRDLVGTRDVPHALVARHDVIGAPPTDGGAARPAASMTPLAARWRQTERPTTREAAPDRTPVAAHARPDGAAGWVDPLSAPVAAPDVAPPPGLLEQLGRTAAVDVPMQHGVELLDDPMPRGVELLDGAGSADTGGGPDGRFPGPATVGADLKPGLATDLAAGLGPVLRQVRRGPARPAQRRVTAGVVWPADPSAHLAVPHPAAQHPTESLPAALAGVAATAHPGGHDAPADATPYAPSATSSAGAPAAPAAPAAAVATPQDVADVVRHALLLDRERSGSLADLW